MSIGPHEHPLTADAVDVEAARLSVVKRYDVLDTPPDGHFDRITRMATQIFGVPISLVTIVDEDRVWFKSRHGVDATEAPRGPGLCTSAILDDSVWVANDAATDPRTLSNPLVAGELGLRFYAGAPLITRDGFRLGTLCIIDQHARTISPDESAMLADLAALVVSELELRLAARTLHAQQLAAQVHSDQLRLLSAAVATIEDVVVITDADVLDEPGPSIVFVNDAFERRTGYSSDEVIGRSPRFLQGPDTDRNELDRIKSALENRQSVTAEVINYERDGRPYSVEIAIVPILDRDGECTHFVSVQRDVSDRRRAEERSRQTQRLEALGLLTGGVAHDFNNLLSVILGYADQLAIDDNLTDDHRHVAEIIRTAAERGADLTSRLLSFGRMQVLNPSSIDVNKRLTSLVDNMLRRTLGADVDIELDLDPDVGCAEIDPSQFESAMINLTANARDAVAEGGRLLIRTSTLVVAEAKAVDLDIAAGRYVVVEVIDDGQGIDAETLAQIFDPFFTTKPSGKGTGLGLAMVYGFVKQSNGAVSIESTPGHSTAVTMLLPRADPALLIAEPAPAPPPDIKGKGALVLLVEDNAPLRSLARSQLLALGYRVIEAGDGATALTMLTAEPTVALLFTDVQLPGGMNGKTLADAAHLERPHLPVLFTSGSTQHALSTDGRLAQGVRLLKKPYCRADLAAALAAALADDEQPS